MKNILEESKHAKALIECHLYMKFAIPAANYQLCKAPSQEKRSRNTREAVKALTKEYPCYDGIAIGKAFLFGPGWLTTNWERSRTYHSAAILVVNARTLREYELAFGCVTRMYLRAFKTKLRVDTVLGAVEDAKFNAIRMWTHSVMPILYNVHKKTRHLQTAEGVAVITEFMDMHYTSRNFWLEKVTIRAVAGFLLSVKQGTTHNPCEVFSASVKRHVQRKTNEICALLRSMMTLSKDVGCDVPSPSSLITAPNVGIKKTAK
ncbi:hypothetical protein PHMEG_00020803 [Phytophthora megakarya]|uniref:Uncharacterized protein n=1 Tax=Phytophthora megakarya TaxID=4795 RepID=A0A225VNF8_9STRA|nr:hypothetical protein PHMEG_00020803 [Phytophthora megakarya]